MNSTHERPTRVRAAIALSIAAHLCALLLLTALLSDGQIDLTGDVDSPPMLFVTRMVHREAGVHRADVARPAAVRHSSQVVRAAKPTPSSPAPMARRAAVSLPLRPAASARAARAAIHERPRMTVALAAAPTTAPTPSRTVAAAPPTPTPTPLPTPAPAATAATVAAANDGGLFSQDYPPAFTAPGEFAALRARLTAPVHIRIEVDENGRATDVLFVRPLADPAVAQQIRSELLALHYVPADCNGLHCEGTLEIVF
jgi:hypothetical protein